jgi:mannose/fructose/N-acetylgalactosamine-specific phosphotransferase system component IID
MTTKINRANITRHLIEYQLDMVGKRLEDTLDDDMWYFNWTMTREQHAAFKAYAIPLLKKTFKFNKAKAESTFDWFNLQFGLRIKS